MADVAIALRPQLVLRARDLCGRRADVDAEDLVSVALLAMVTKPPDPKDTAQLHHWLRKVLYYQAASAHRSRHGLEFVSWDAMQEGRPQGAET